MRVEEELVSSGRGLRPAETATIPLDPVAQYLRDISQLPGLSPDEIIQIAQRRDNASSEDERIDAIHQLVQGNLPLVVSVVQKKKYQTDLDKLVLIQEGNIGLTKAAANYDWRRGFKFSTYATPWINKFIQLAVINDGHAIRIPDHAYRSQREVRHQIDELQMSLGGGVSEDEVLDMLGLTKGQRELFQRGRTVFSLDRPVREDSDTPMHQYLPDSSQNVEDEALDHIITTAVRELPDILDEQLADIIIKRYGLDGEEPKSQRAIGEIYHRGANWVSDREKAALAKLREHPAARQLRDIVAYRIEDDELQE